MKLHIALVGCVEANVTIDPVEHSELGTVSEANMIGTTDHLAVFDCRVKLIKFEFACQIVTGFIEEDDLPYDMVANMVMNTPTDDCDDFLFWEPSLCLLTQDEVAHPAVSFPRDCV